MRNFFIYKFLLFISVFLVFTFGLGNRCTGPSDIVDFTPNEFESSVSKAWRSPIYVDFGAIDESDASLAKHNGTLLGGALERSPYPLALANISVENFITLFSQSNSVPPALPTAINLYSTSVIDIGGALTVEESLFTPLDSGLGVESLRPMVKTDDAGNACLLFLNQETLISHQRPILSRYNRLGEFWLFPMDLSDSTEVGDIQETIALAVNPKNKNCVAIWRQSGKAYYNEWNSSSGLRFVDGIHSFIEFHDATVPFSAVEDRGMDLGFDQYGNGYLAYVDSDGVGNRIRTARWQNVSIQGVSLEASQYQDVTQNSIENIYGFPRIFVSPAGKTHLFFYADYDAVSSAKLMWSVSSSFGSSVESQTFSTPIRFDGSIGDVTEKVYVHDSLNERIRPPVLAINGHFAALAFIKTDGTNRRFYVSRHDGSSSWENAVAIDEGGAGKDVHWIDVAINASGQILAAYSATGEDLKEHVYGVVFNGLSWSSPTQLDASSDFEPETSPQAKTFPIVSIDSNGNGVVGFYVRSSTHAAYPRRSALVFYR